MNNTATNICVQDFVYTSHIFISHRYIPKREITRSCGNSFFKLLRNCQTVFKSSCTILHSKQELLRVLISLCPRQHLLLSIFLIGAIFVDVNGSSLWVWFAFPWWLKILVIVLYVIGHLHVIEEMWNHFFCIYSGYKSLFIDIIWNYFLQFSELFFTSLMVVFEHKSLKFW